MNSRVSGEERVFSLVLALVASPLGLTKAELLSSVYGYAEQTRAEAKRGSLERQFERDKDLLRKLGVPIEALDSPEAPGDNRFTRYRISKDRLELPPSVRFTPEELSVLRLAALAWSEGSLGEQSKWATMKLTSLESTPDLRLLGIVPQISLTEPSASALQLAIDAQVVVRFDYRLPARDEAMGRRVAPLRLHRAHGRWHLIAHDLERGSDRVFLLSRITSAVHRETDSFDPTLFDRVDPMIEELLALEASSRVRVSAKSGSAAESRLSARAGMQGAGSEPVIEFGTLDVHELAGELTAFGEDVIVQDPPELRELLIQRLKLIRDQHHGRSAGEGADA